MAPTAPARGLSVLTLASPAQDVMKNAPARRFRRLGRADEESAEVERQIRQVPGFHAAGGGAGGMAKEKRNMTAKAMPQSSR